MIVLMDVMKAHSRCNRIPGYIHRWNREAVVKCYSCNSVNVEASGCVELQENDLHPVRCVTQNPQSVVNYALRF